MLIIVRVKLLLLLLKFGRLLLITFISIVVTTRAGSTSLLIDMHPTVEANFAHGLDAAGLCFLLYRIKGHG